MKVLLTGGSGDLGKILSSELLSRGDVPVNLDVTPPAQAVGEFVCGSVLDRSLLESMLPGVDCIVHIAAWHGIHEFRKEKDAFQFWDLNVNGTFTLLESCVGAGCSNFVFISSSSVDDWPGVYAHSKLVGEDLMRTYVARHHMKIITLRPRAFIPYWNRSVYANFEEWARWYWKGSVHISDVSQAVLKAIDTLRLKPEQEFPALSIDGACDFSQHELDTWDLLGPGTTFRQRFGEVAYRLAVEAGLDPTSKPSIMGFSDAEKWIDYKPHYGFGNMLEDLATHGKQ